MANAADSCLASSSTPARLKVSTWWGASVTRQDTPSTFAHQSAASTHLQLRLVVILGPIHLCLSLVTHSCMGSLGFRQILGICLQLFVEASLCLCSSKPLLPLLRRRKVCQVVILSSDVDSACLKPSLRLQIASLTMPSLQMHVNAITCRVHV